MSRALRGLPVITCSMAHVILINVHKGLQLEWFWLMTLFHEFSRSFVGHVLFAAAQTMSRLHLNPFLQGKVPILLIKKAVCAKEPPGQRVIWSGLLQI